MFCDKSLLAALVAFAVCSAVVPANAQVIFSDGFESDDNCAWTIELDGNDFEVNSSLLPDAGDCSGGVTTVESTLHQSDDVDFFTFRGIDEFGCPMDPSFAVSADFPVTPCVYLECVNGTTMVTCPAGTSESVSSEGRAGCCLDTASVQAELDIDVSCIGTSDDTTDFWIRIDDPQNNCVHFTAMGNP